MPNEILRIDALHLRNFRCFTDHLFELHPEFNVFVGVNGAGKTAILEALAVATSSWLLGIRDVEPRHIRPEDIQRRSIDRGRETTFEDQLPVSVMAVGRVYQRFFQWDRVLNSRQGRTTTGDATAIKALSQEADTRGRGDEPFTLPLIAYYGAGRLWQQPRDTERRRGSFAAETELSRFAGYRNAMDPRCSPRELTRWLERQAQIEFEEGVETGLYGLVRRAMTGMLEDAQAVRYAARYKEIMVAFADGSARLFNNLSDGQRNMVALAGDIAMRMARLNPHLGEEALNQTPGIVLIDELDLHLHPRWQRHVVADLRRTFPQIQFVTTTHSPQIISEVQPENLVLIRPGGVVERGRQSYGLDANWILKHIMGVDERPVPAQATIEEIERAMESQDWQMARNRLDDLREMLHGDDAESTRLEASINTLEMLADDEENEGDMTERAVDTKAA